MNGLRTALLLLLFALLAPVANAQEKTSEEKKPDPSARFWEARRVMLAGKPKDAAELFRTIARDHPDAAVADDCLYWMGRCYLRIDDREPDAVVAFKRIVTKLPTSPFVDDAARELMRLGDVTMVGVLAPRLASTGIEAELAARGLAELDDPRGIEWLAKHRGESRPVPVPAAPAPDPEQNPGKETRKPADRQAEDPKRSEVAALKAEIRRLREDLDESVRLLESLLAERADEKKTEKKDADGTPKTGNEKTDSKSAPESEKKK